MTVCGWLEVKIQGLTRHVFVLLSANSVWPYAVDWTLKSRDLLARCVVLYYPTMCDTKKWRLSSWRSNLQFAIHRTRDLSCRQEYYQNFNISTSLSKTATVEDNRQVLQCSDSQSSGVTFPYDRQRLDRYFCQWKRKPTLWECWYVMSLTMER